MSSIYKSVINLNNKDKNNNDKWLFFARSQNVLYNARVYGYRTLYLGSLNRLICEIPIKKKRLFFISLNFHIVFREEKATSCQSFKTGGSIFFKCPRFTKV